MGAPLHNPNCHLGFQSESSITDPMCCTQEDVECDFGFQRVNGTCVAMPGIQAAECPALQGSQYKMSASHLRQIHEDVCTDLSRVRSSLFAGL